jgi:hypothetical protein
MSNNLVLNLRNLNSNKRKSVADASAPHLLANSLAISKKKRTVDAVSSQEEEEGSESGGSGSSVVEADQAVFLSEDFEVANDLGESSQSSDRLDGVVAPARVMNLALVQGRRGVPMIQTLFFSEDGPQYHDNNPAFPNPSSLFTNIIKYTAANYVTDRVLDSSIPADQLLIAGDRFSFLMRKGLALEGGPLARRTFIVLFRNGELDEEIASSKFTFGGKDVQALHSAVYLVTKSPQLVSNPTLVFTLIHVYNDCPAQYKFPSQHNLNGVHRFTFLTVVDPRLLVSFEQMVPSILERDTPEGSIVQSAAPVQIVRKAEYTGTKRMNDPMTGESLSFVDRVTFDGDADESRFSRRMMSTHRRAAFLNVCGVKIKMSTFVYEILQAGNSVYEAADGPLFPLHSLGEIFFLNWLDLKDLPIFETEGGLSKRLILLIKGDWHGGMLDEIIALNLCHFSCVPLDTVSDYSVKGYTGKALSNLGQVLSLINGYDYCEVFEALKNEIASPSLMRSNSWDVGYLRERIEQCIKSIFWLLRGQSEEDIRIRFPGASTTSSADSHELLMRVVQSLPPLDLNSSNLKRSNCERWKSSSSVVEKKKGKSATSVRQAKGSIVSKGESGSSSKSGTSQPRINSAMSGSKNSTTQASTGVCAIFLQSELKLKGGKPCHYGKDCQYSHHLPPTKAGVLEAIDKMRSVLVRKGSFEAAKEAVTKRFSGGH